MPNTTCTLVLGIMVTAAQTDPTSDRVRTEDPVLAALIQDASRQSTTFRRLVEAIAATDGVVYVVRDRCSPPLRACLVLSMTVAGPYRILRVIVDDRKADSDAVVSIAHELQHALEVLGHRDVTSGAAMYGLFERIGMWREHSFETDAAIQLEEAVRSELRQRSGQGK
jgi:hypothetical protein